MQPKLRTTIAFIAGRMITGVERSSIYDPLQDKSVHFETTLSPNYIKVFNLDRGCYTAGPMEGNVFDLYDFGHQHLVDLQISGNTFQGWDDLASCRFSGEVNGDDVSFHDEGEAKTFRFSFKEP